MNKPLRLKPHEIRALNLPIHLHNRYRLSGEKLQQLKALREDLGAVKRLFFDIETSPNIVYTWRAGWNITVTPESIIEERKIICISYKWENKPEVHRLSWDKNMCDKQMLIDFIKVANIADELVAHNGDRFDIKWIRTRCIYHRISMFPSYRSLDTLKKAKSSFYLNSNKLDYIAKFLKVGAKMETGGFDLWKQVMVNDREALEKMGLYCDQDVLVLEAVYQEMKNYFKQNLHEGALDGKSKFSCPSCSSEKVKYLKLNSTAAGTLKRLMQCGVCEHTYEINNSSYMLMLKFKAQELL
jgi:hypothetical protein